MPRSKRKLYSVTSTYFEKCVETLFGKVAKTKGDRYDKLWYQLYNMVDSIEPVELHTEPSDDTMRKFRLWVNSVSNGSLSLKTLKNMLTKLSAHKKYIEVTDEYDTNETRVLYNRMKNTKIKFHTFANHLRVLRDLRPHSTGSWGDVDVVTGADYCHVQGKMIPARFELLGLTGFRHTQEDIKQVKKLNTVRLTEYESIRATLVRKNEGKRTPITFAQYEDLAQVLSVDLLDDVNGKDKTEVVSILEETPFNKHRRFYLMLKACIEGKSPEFLEYMDTHLPFSFHKIDRFNRFRLISPWHNVLVSDVKEAYTQSCESHFMKHCLLGTLCDVGGIMWKLKTYVDNLPIDVYPKTLVSADGENPMQLFIEHYDADMLTAFILHYCNQVNTRNDRVLSSNSPHQAIRYVKKVIRLFRTGFAKYRKWDVSVSVKGIIKKIPMERIPANPETSREYTDEQMDAMLEVARKDPELSLMFIILREVGLRVGCIVNLTYNTLFGPCHIPRDVCTALEKKKTLRRFMPSTRLKAAAKVYSDHLRKTHTDAELYGEFFLFNPLNPVIPATTQRIRHLLQAIATKANITNVHVHPHAFRHTIVREMQKSQIPMDLISKYMGHKTPIVTEQHYGNQSIKTLMSELEKFNPNSSEYQARVVKMEAETDYIMALQSQRDIARTVIRTVLQTIEKHSDKPEVLKCLLEIGNELPDLKQNLDFINDSIDGSTCSSTVEHDE